MPLSKSHAVFIVGLLLAIAAWPAHAHKINMFAFAEGDEVFVEGYFTDGKKPKHSPVLVYNAAGDILLEGQTDEEGAFTFPLPASAPIRITLNAGQGHLAEYELSAEDLGLDAPGASPLPSSPAANGQQPSTTLASGLSDEQLQAMIRKAVGQSLRPVMRSLSELKEQRSFSDIIGGIGIIMGIGGIFLYYKARKMLAEAKSAERK